MVPVPLATAAAGIIVGLVALALGGLITEIIDVISMGNIYLMLVITAIASLISAWDFQPLPPTLSWLPLDRHRAIVSIAGAQEWFVPPECLPHRFCLSLRNSADDTPPVGHWPRLTLALL